MKRSSESDQRTSDLFLKDLITPIQPEVTGINHQGRAECTVTTANHFMKALVPLSWISSDTTIELIPAVAQDWLDGAVLMVAWMNRSRLSTRCVLVKRTTGVAPCRLWHKGATSGHTRFFQGIRYDVTLMFCCSASTRRVMSPVTPVLAAASMKTTNRRTGDRGCLSSRCLHGTVESDL